mgnify:CR=1 FL=1
MSKVSKEFNEGRSHMGIVCETNEVALFIRDFSDYVHTQIRVEGKQPELKDFSNKKIVGVLTLEDVIEKTLRVDIADEGDLADAVKAFLLRNQEAKDMEYKDLVPYM